jgi:hypothetical protein
VDTDRFHAFAFGRAAYHRYGIVAAL